MKKKTLTIIIALACAVVLALGCFAVQALTLSGRNAADVALNDVDPFEQNRDASEYYYYWTDENDPVIRFLGHGIRRILPNSKIRKLLRVTLRLFTASSMQKQMTSKSG